MLRIDVALSDAGGMVNEDAVGHFGDAAWVIDGATGVGSALLDAPSDAAWLAQTANRLIAEALADDPERSTIEMLRDVMTRCAAALADAQVRAADGAHELPSAAFAMVRLRGDVAEITALADCRVAAVDETGDARLFGTYALDAVESRTLAAVKAIREEEPDIDAEALKRRLLPGLSANRHLKNRDGGYWVLGAEPAAADHVWQASVPLRPGQRFAIASDGFLRLVELFGTATPADLLTIATPEEGAAWLAQLRDLERQPDSLRRHNRVKRHDDASLITCSWDPIC
ncbi:protein phosphatase 2C domain-containing protein [uncultured Sphingomonas sp.]|uniref:protein phosphatase 2C domain-containing protein n=1 Tax=uncultured Sphingomonas sp. TaxID=158754 RepID=UPI0025D588B6|nr:protein phosphatase 2C domain-containing protein [uncultured Sphingomonas sp.]